MKYIGFYNSKYGLFVTGPGRTGKVGTMFAKYMMLERIRCEVLTFPMYYVDFTVSDPVDLRFDDYIKSMSDYDRCLVYNTETQELTKLSEIEN